MASWALTNIFQITRSRAHSCSTDRRTRRYCNYERRFFSLPCICSSSSGAPFFSSLFCSPLGWWRTNKLKKSIQSEWYQAASSNSSSGAGYAFLLPAASLLARANYCCYCVARRWPRDFIVALLLRLIAASMSTRVSLLLYVYLEGIRLNMYNRLCAFSACVWWWETDNLEQFCATVAYCLAKRYISNYCIYRCTICALQANACANVQFG